MAGMNAVGGGPVGGNVLLMNDGSAAPTPGGSVPGGTGDMKTRFNTHIYDYFLKNGYFDCARALMGQDGVQLSTAPRTKNSPGRRRDGDMNGVDDNSMDMDSKDDITSQYPDDLPRPSVGGGGPGGSAFLFDWYCLFWDIFSAQRQRKGGPDMGPAPAYIQHTQQVQRMREQAQAQLLRGQQPMMGGQYPGMPRGPRNGMAPNEMQKAAMANNARMTPQQMAQLQQKQQMMNQHPMQRDPSDMDINGHRPQSPASTENAPSPSKRPRLDGQQFNGAMAPNGRGQGMPPQTAQHQANIMLIQNGINPNSLSKQQFASFTSQNPSVQQKSIQVYAQNLAQHHNRSGMNNQGLPNGMMNAMPNAGSPMMQPMSDAGGMSMPMEPYFQANAQMRPGMPAGGGQGGNHALQDYQMQLMLLEQQNKKRLMMARQEQDSMTRADGQPAIPGQPGMPGAPGMSPSGSRNGPSPNPNDQMKRGTPQMGHPGLPGSPNPGDGIPGTRGSPAPMNFGGQMPPEMLFQMKGMEGMVPGAPGMRPPTTNPAFNGQMQMDSMGRAQQAGRMPSGNWQQGPQGQPMMQQPPPGQPQPMGTPQQRNEMPPPQAPPAGGANAGRTQPSSPQAGAAPPTPQQSNKANPKNKKDKNEPRKRPTKKGSAANAATGATPNASEAEPPPTPTPSTPITPVHPNSFNGQKGQTAPGANPQAPTSAPTAPLMPQQPDPTQQPPFGDMNVADGFNLDFSALDTGDVLENFDFDSFLNTDDAGAGFSFDANVYGEEVNTGGLE